MLAHEQEVNSFAPSPESVYCEQLQRILESPYRRVRIEGEILDIEKVLPDPDILKFRGNSAHAVFGVQLTGRGANGEIILPCVVKPHHLGEDKLARRNKGLSEFETGRFVRECGLRTVEPIAWVRGDKGEEFVVTRYDDSLQAGDTIEWEKIADYSQEEFIGLIDQTARILALSQANGIFHFDIQPKNIGMDKGTGAIFLFDWESAEIYPDTKNLSDPELFEKVYEGIKVFVSTAYDHKGLRAAIVKLPLGQLRTADDLMYFLGKDFPKYSTPEAIERFNSILGGMGETPLLINGQAADLRADMLRHLGQQGILKTIRRSAGHEATNKLYWRNMNKYLLDNYFKYLEGFGLGSRLDKENIRKRLVIFLEKKLLSDINPS